MSDNHTTAKRRQAIESLERWKEQMVDLVESGVFGKHQPRGCLICPANRIIDDIEKLIKKMNDPNTNDEGIHNGAQKEKTPTTESQVLPTYSMAD